MGMPISTYINKHKNVNAFINAVHFIRTLLTDIYTMIRQAVNLTGSFDGCACVSLLFIVYQNDYNVSDDCDAFWTINRPLCSFRRM